MEKKEILSYQAYDREFPLYGEHVVTQFKSMEANAGIYVHLIEYNGMDAFIPFAQLTKKKYGKIPNLFLIDKIIVMEVTSINEKKRFIDCSKIHVTETEKEKCMDRYTANKFIHNIWYNISLIFNITKDNFYDNFIYPLLYKYKYEEDGIDYYNSNFAIKDFVENIYTCGCDSTFLPNISLSPLEKSDKQGQELIKDTLDDTTSNNKYNIDQKIIDKVVEIYQIKIAQKLTMYRILITINCYDIDGIDGIIDSIKAMEDYASNLIKVVNVQEEDGLTINENKLIKIKYINSPSYAIEYMTIDTPKNVEKLFRDIISFGSKYIQKYKYSEVSCSDHEYKKLYTNIKYASIDEYINSVKDVESINPEY